jgi:hypothetical protein
LGTQKWTGPARENELPREVSVDSWGSPLQRRVDPTSGKAVMIRGGDVKSTRAIGSEGYDPRSGDIREPIPIGTAELKMVEETIELEFGPRLRHELSRQDLPGGFTHNQNQDP